MQNQASFRRIISMMRQMGRYHEIDGNIVYLSEDRSRYLRKNENERFDIIDRNAWQNFMHLKDNTNLTEKEVKTVLGLF